jgi:hypothetical protein
VFNIAFEGKGFEGNGGGETTLLDRFLGGNCGTTRASLLLLKLKKKKKNKISNSY